MLESSSAHVNIEPTALLFVNYNSSRLLSHCISRVQMHGNMLDLIVIVDNGSSASELSALRALYAAVPGLYIISLSENVGFGRACNVGLSYLLSLEYSFVWLLNPDAEPSCGALDFLREAMQQNPRLACVSSILVDHVNGNICSGAYVPPLTMIPRSVVNLGKCSMPFKWSCAASCLVRLAIIRDLGGFSPLFFMYGEDAELCFRFQLNGWDVATSINSLVLHVPGSSSSSVTRLLRYKWHFEAMLLNCCYFPFPSFSALILRLKYLVLSLVIGSFELARTTSFSRLGMQLPRAEYHMKLALSQIRNG